MHIVGTAGHVDHGKSALVAALTGTNPDRWLEEQIRGMTLDLGFAHLRLEDGLETGIIDVPGHERFLHNMLAGAAGMDVLLLVVAANEGVMPQTREHLDILKYLNVRRTIVALTKIDLIPKPERAAARERIAAELRGTIAQAAPALGVSSVSGEGLDELRAQIAQALRELPPRDAGAPVYLPIDRVFTLPGVGTVVTGTLMQGGITAGDVLALQPSGKEVRARTLHVFGASRLHVDAGSRVALNLPGVDRRDIARGEVAVGREFSARANLAVRFTPLPAGLPLLRKRTPVSVYIGSAEIHGTLALEQLPATAEEVRAELHLREPTVAFPGVRFVLRRPSPKTLLGGGFVETLEVTQVPDASSPLEEMVLAALRQRGLSALAAADVALAANLREDVATQTLDALAERGEVLRVRRPGAYVDAAAAGELLSRVRLHLERAHEAEPWAMGLTSIALARALDMAEPLMVRVLAEFVENGRISQRAGYYAGLDHRPTLSNEQRALFDRLIPPYPESSQGTPMPLDGVAQEVRRSAVAGAAKAFDTMLATGALVKVGDDLYRGSRIREIHARMEAFLREHERMTVAQFRDLFGTSRKYAVPLLEWFDAHGVTLRSGDQRTLRKRSA